MAKKKILVVDDEAKIVSLVRAYLERDGYRAVTARDGQTALQLARRERPDLVVLDLMLPEIDGLEVCRTLRRESNIPIIMLTARDEETDKLIGLELGADDYITKPFSPRELVARVRAVLRRTTAPADQPEQIAISGLVIDTVRHEASVHGQLLKLTPSEFKLLEALARHPGRVFTRLQLLDLVQGEAYEGYERTIDTHIKNLRHKIEVLTEGVGFRITTVYGVGYKFEVNKGA
ncbi:MAG: response regulator transcription factor [Chloroflexi bacterium]|nr:response regulator transcription factor [Chloroflexota bacterium]MCL5074335.1 response regulator transcription factor [Chloroflexota bacterium]